MPNYKLIFDNSKGNVIMVKKIQVINDEIKLIFTVLFSKNLIFFFNYIFNNSWIGKNMPDQIKFD